MAGVTFVVSDHSGAIDPSTWQGLYHRDVRMLSRYRLRVDGRDPHLLSSHREGTRESRQVHVVSSDAYGSPTALLLRHRRVGATVREKLEIRTFAEPLTDVELTIDLGTDFSPLLPLKHTLDRPHQVTLTPDGDGLLAVDGRACISVHVKGAAAEPSDDRLVLRVDATPGNPWIAEVVFTPTFDGMGSPQREAANRSPLGLLSPATAWERAVSSALADLDGLRVDIPSMGLSYLGAGVPWFMALFGRDTLIASWQSLIAGPDVALGVLRSLAAHQGTEDEPKTGEQPGRILHELRTGGSEVFGLPAGTAYYGTVDASPLFVMLLGELHRWGAPPDAVHDLLPAARAALDWCVEYGDLDGDGYIEYRSDPDGLVNQGWKDSGDAMVHADGAQAASPIALAEVQAYLYAAYVALAELETAYGDPAQAAGLQARASALRAAFQRDFWVAEQAVIAMALDADKRPLAVASSNMGHCLWSGLLDGEVATATARRLARPDLCATWGVRTLSSDEAVYNPLSYHLGSIWPHDSAIAAAGLARYGHVEAASRLVTGLLAAAEVFDWRLPELLAGFDAEEVPHPVGYPVACSPQAWSAGAPLLLLRTALRLDPDVPAGRIHVAPLLPANLQMEVTGIPVAGGTLAVRVRGADVEVLDAPAGLEVVTSPRPMH